MDKLAIRIQNTLQTTGGQAEHPPNYRRAGRTQNIEQKTQSPQATRRGGKSEIRNQNTELKTVAKEMEALFAYQLIKAMRETANNISSNKKGFGNNIYMSLFDMEISKLFAERGLGIQDALIRSLERTDIQPQTNTDLKDEKI